LTKISLAVDLAGLKLRVPTLNAAGVLGITPSLLKQVYESGAGAVVTKSIGPEPRSGHQNPTLVTVKGGALNAMGLPNPGVEYYSDGLRMIDFPVVVSFFGSTIQEFREVASHLSEVGADALELNCSCPNVIEEMGMLAEDPINVEKVTSAVKEEADIPVYVKLSPNVTDIVEIARAAERGGADAITATNALKGMAISVEFKRPVLTNLTGGLSGSALKPVSLRCVWEIAKAVDIPVIGCGGVSSWRDAVEYILAGASAVEIGTAIMHKGLKIFQEVSDGLESYMNRNGYSRITDFMGAAHET
jgi:dihydroorotate dehydrogenase (NAD+) catalytic subunit